MPCLVIVWLIWIYLDLFGVLRLVLNCDLIAIIESEDAEGDPQDQAQEPEGFEQGKSPLIMLNPVYENANDLLFCKLHSNTILYLNAITLFAIEYTYHLIILPSNCLPFLDKLRIISSP